MPDSKRGTILLIDDDTELRWIVSAILREEGFNIEEAENGLVALERLKTHLPDLIMLDMKMPVMNGCEFAKRFKQTYNKQVPILVFTASENAQDRASDLNADGWIGKPFNLDEMIRVIKQHISQRSIAA